MIFQPAASIYPGPVAEGDTSVTMIEVAVTAVMVRAAEAENVALGRHARKEGVPSQSAGEPGGSQSVNFWSGNVFHRDGISPLVRARHWRSCLESSV